MSIISYQVLSLNLQNQGKILWYIIVCYYSFYWLFFTFLFKFFACCFRFGSLVAMEQFDISNSTRATKFLRVAQNWICTLKITKIMPGKCLVYYQKLAYFFPQKYIYPNWWYLELWFNSLSFDVWYKSVA